MFTKIIDFFKNLFSTSNEKNVVATSELLSNEMVTTSATENKYTLKVLLNNCIKGYSLINLKLSTDGNDYCINKLAYDESSVIEFNTSNKPSEIILKCGIKCESDGEIINNLSTKVNVSVTLFTTINVTDTLLGLRKITFDTNIENNKEEKYEK